MMEATPSERRSDVIWAAEQAHGYPTSTRIRMMNEALDKYDAPLLSSHTALVAALDKVKATLTLPGVRVQALDITDDVAVGGMYETVDAALDAARNLEGTNG